MNYQRIYEQLTSKDMIADYTEIHHIIPKCMGGSDEPGNLVRLTPEAHYVAHQLLVKIYPDNYKLVYAVHMMCIGELRNNKKYGWIRRKHAIAVSVGQIGKVVSEETKAKIREAQKNMSPEAKAKKSAKISEYNRNMPAETRAKISNTLKEYFKTHKPGNKPEHYSAETRAKMSADRKGRVPPNKGKTHSAETRAKLSAAAKGRIPPNKGVPMSEENRAKLKEWHKNNPRTKEQRERQSAALKGRTSHMKGKTHSAETRAKISAAAKGKIPSNKGIPVSAETRAKISASSKGRKASDITKAKMSAARKGEVKPKTTCPHCNKEGAVAPMTYHHFDNCKLKP